MISCRFVHFNLRSQINNTRIKTLSFSSYKNGDNIKKIDLSDNNEQPSEIKKNQEVSIKLNNLLQEMISVDMSKKPNLSPKLDYVKKFKRESKNPRTVNLGPKIVEAVKNVSIELSTNNDHTKIEMELLEKITEMNTSTIENLDEMRNLSKKSYLDLRDLIKDMKVESDENTMMKRSEQIKQILGHQKPHSTYKTKVNKYSIPVDEKLGNGVPFNIFDKIEDHDKDITEDTWHYLNNKHLNLTTTHPPRNTFEEMILWTNQGKLWNFPINNEIGLDKEAAVSFYEHIFLDNHILDWCPKQGPIRHFMELVSVGLSKNPYFTVEQKIKHLDWYKKYFLEKKSIINEIGLTI